MPKKQFERNKDGQWISTVKPLPSEIEQKKQVVMASDSTEPSSKPTKKITASVSK